MEPAMTVMKKSLFLLLMLLCLGLGSSEIPQGVLAPENANEARLNGLQPPSRVLDAIGVRPGMTVAEIGAGQGRYAVQLAVRVGAGSKVYAEDIDADALDHLRRRCRRWKLGNVETVLGDVTDPKLPTGRLDLIWIVSSYHHFDDPVALLRRARPALKPDGRLAIGEWISIHETDRHGTSPENIIRQVEAAGYVFERSETFLKANNFLIYLFSNGRSR
jgi:SAM-dependent methyltransferase